MDNGPCLVGVDAGTSVVKAVAFDAAGNEIYASETPMPLRRPEPLWVEQDMDELWQKVKDRLRDVRMRLKELRNEIAGIGITSTGDGTWIIDQGGTASGAGFSGAMAEPARSSIACTLRGSPTRRLIFAAPEFSLAPRPLNSFGCGKISRRP